MRSSVPLKALPPAANAISVTQDATAWVNGAWAEISSSAPANSVLAGILTFGGTFSAAEREIDVGIGASSSEVAIATFRMGLNTSALKSNKPLMLLVPITGIAGQRVSARVRTSDTGSDVISVAVLYYDNPSNQITTDKKLTCVPSAADGVSITPSGTTWNNSSYVELTSGLSNKVAIAGVAVRWALNPNDCEIDLATGGSGSETVITTLRGSWRDGQFLNHMLLNGIYTIPASTRVAIRVRKSGTNTSALLAALLYYDNLGLPGNSGGAGKGQGGKKGGGGGPTVILAGGTQFLNLGLAGDFNVGG